MKRSFLLLSTLLVLLPCAMQAQTVYMTDGFENGFNPTCDKSCKTTAWTQEYFDKAQGVWVSEAPANSQPWKTETGTLLYPTGAAKGQGRAYFRNEPDQSGSVQTAGYRTRLVTPVMNLETGYQPILRFYHAQDKYTGDFDTLRVYYRTGQGLAWELLSEYTSYIKRWKFEEIALPAVSDYYQIAFEANENIGRGIVLDSVIVRTRPQITTPHDVTFIELHDNGMTIQWQASMDADNFRVVVFNKADLDLNVNPGYLDSASVIVADSVVDSEIQTLRINNLQGGSTYYVQIMSLGEDENSVWCDPVSIRLKATEYIPYFEDFTMKYTSNEIADQQLKTWFWGGDYEPVIPLWIGEEYFGYYSPDASPAVAFIGTKKSDSGEFPVAYTLIPAGQTSYLVSPEIASKEDGFAINQCHVTFWGTVRHATNDYKKSIIVGVATDPEDPSTFVGIDTCFVYGYESFIFFDVDLASYEGTGRYIVFASNFDQQNQFFIDKVTIEKRPAIGMVKMQSITSIPDTTSVQLAWAAVPGATGYNIKYTKLDKQGTKTPLFVTSMENVKDTAVAGTSVTLTNLQIFSKYAVSIQAIGGAWSQPAAFYTSDNVTYPKTFGFEQAEYTYTLSNDDKAPYSWWVFSNDPDIPYCYSGTTYSHAGSYSLYLVANVGNDGWAVAPWAENVKDLEILFYDKCATSYVGSKLQIGVMTDPRDLNTFVAVNEITVSDQQQKFYANFTEYNGDGHYIAFRWAGNVNPNVKSCHYIDDVTIRPLGTCLPVSKIDIANITSSSMQITWPKGEAEKWRVMVNDALIKEEDLATATGNVCDTVITVDTLQIDSLMWASAYYIYVQTQCTDTTSEWASTVGKTSCPDIMSLPYTEDFERFATGTGNYPECWTPAFNGTITSYPYVYNSSTYAHSGLNSLYMYAYTSYGSFISLPEVEKPLNTVKVSFWAYGSTAGNKVFVGVMTTPGDPDSFEAIDSVSTTASSEFYSVSLTNYKGNGKYIALSTWNAKSNSVYVDDVTVEDMTDDAPIGFRVVDATTSSISIKWDGITSDKWQVIASKKYYALTAEFDPTTIPASDQVGADIVDSAAFAIESGLEALTKYYFYVKSTAGTKWGMDSLSTACTTWNPREKYTEGFESYGKTVVTTLSATTTYLGYYKNALVPTCWTVGNEKYGTDLSAATTYTIRGYFPYIVSNGTGTTTTTNYYDKGTANSTYKYAPDGCNSLKMNTSTTYGITWAAMPQLECSDEDLQSLVITAQAKLTASGTVPHALIVGIMDDPTDLSTFVVLDSIATGAGTTGTSAVQSIEVAIGDKNYTGKGRYIAFRTAYNPGATASSAYKVCATTVYLDNVSVALASCAAPNISFAQVTDTTARVYSGLKIDNPWKYYLSFSAMKASDLDAGIMPADSLIVDSAIVGDGSIAVPYAPLKGLLPDTTYYLAMATVCGETTSAWKVASFKTLCADVPVESFYDGFEDYKAGTGNPVGCWTVDNVVASATGTYVPSAIASTLTGSKNVLSLYAYKSTANGAYAITPGLDFPEGKSLKDYQLRSTILASSSTTSLSTTTTTEFRLLIGVATDPSDMSTVVMLDTILFNPGINTFIYPFDKYQGAGKFVVFMAQVLNDAMTYSRIYMDDVQFEAIPACQIATKIKVDSIAENSMALSWQGKAPKYWVALSTELYADSVKEDSIATSANVIKMEVEGMSYVVNGLKANTNYYVYVQALCGDSEKSEWSYDVCQARTECPTNGVELPFNDGFEEYTTGNIYCYNGVYTNASSPTAYPAINTTASNVYSGKKALYLYSAASLVSAIVTPEINVADMKTLQISFWYKAYAKDKHLYIGTVSNRDSILETFDTIAVIKTTATTYQQYMINLDTIAKDIKTKNIAFLVEKVASGYGYIDDLKIRYIPTCYIPTNITVSNIGLESATVSFTKADSADTQWQVRLTNKTTKAEQTLDITDTTAVLPLTPSTQYTVEVRTNCEGDYSEWSDPIIFNSKYEIETYTYTFSKDEQGTTSVRSPKATADTYFIHPALTSEAEINATYTYFPYSVLNTTAYSYSTDPSANTEAAALKFCTSATYDSSTVILPVVLNPADKQLSFNMRAGHMYTNAYSTEAYRCTFTTIYQSAAITLGTVDSLKGYQTFQEIQTYKPGTMAKNDTLKAASNYAWEKVVMPLNKIDLKGKQLALMMKGCGSATMYIDDLAIEASEGYITPTLIKVQAFDTTALLTWNDAGATSYNVYVIDTTLLSKPVNYIPYLQDADSACITKITGIVGTSYMVQGLAEKSTYAFYVENADKAGDMGALSGRRIVTTSCVALNGNDYVYGFEPGPGYIMNTNPSKSTPDGFTFQWPTSTTATDTVYKTPECWKVGLGEYDITSTTYKSYIPTLCSNAMTAAATSQYKYAKSGYSCMKFYTTTSYKDAAYAVMPLLTLDMDTAELEFFGRCTYEASTGKIYTASYLKGTSYSTKMAVGTMTDPTDLSTFVALDTIEYDYSGDILTTSMVASDDPTGNKYWQRFIVPLKGATGTYIAFKQVGYGYFYMDELKIGKRQTARSPRNLDEVEIGSTTTKVAWKGMEEGGVYTLQYVAVSEAGSKVDWTNATTIDSIVGNEYTITGLAINGMYVWRVAQKTEDLLPSDYAIYRFFRTECEAMNPNGYKTGFECDKDTDPYSMINATYKQNECWKYVNFGTGTAVASCPYNIEKTSTVSYAHSGSFGLKLYAYSTTYMGAAVTPYIDAEIGQPGVGFDTLQVSFWACPSGWYVNGNGTYTASNNTYSKTVEVGTCTDPTDSATYTVLKVCTYEVANNNLPVKSQANAGNDYAFRKFTVKLNEATGPYVFIRASKTMADGATKTSSTMYIDDVAFETLQKCEPVFDLKSSDVTTREAKLSWASNGGNNFDVWVSTNGAFTDTIAYSENLQDTTISVTGLQPATQYFFKVKNYCDQARKEASEWTQNAYFYTLKAPMFEEQFTTDNIKTEAKGWKTSFTFAKDVFNGATLRDTTLSGVYNSWYRVQNNAMSGYALRSYLYYTTTGVAYQAHNWLVSPAIVLEQDSALVSFDAALTFYSTTTGEPIQKQINWNTGWDDQFMVIVSDDAGQTWKRENATIWNNETSNDPTDSLYVYGKGDYVLTDLSNKPQKLFVDLSKYTGKTVKIAFYAENTVNNAQNAIHIDNVHINYATQQKTILDLCQFEDVENVYGFNINGDTVSAGQCVKERYNLAAEPGMKDSIFVMEANYKEAPVYDYEITICEGTPFSYMGFNEHSAPGTYRMKLTSKVTGCDSIVNFTIKHTPSFLTTIDTTICYGSSITFNEQVYTTAGKYTAYLKACEAFGGCDSTVVLNLSVTTPIQNTINQAICKGSSYVWQDKTGVLGDTVISDRGSYKRVYPAANGCDSTVTLNLTIIEPSINVIYDTICAGDVYYLGSKTFTENVLYVDTLIGVSSVGCDSVRELHLTVIPAKTYTFDATICQGDSMLYGSKYAKTTGQFVDTIMSLVTGCDSIVTMNLIVAQPASTDFGNVTVCQGGSYLLGKKVIYPQVGNPQMYYDTLKTVNGCDSILSAYVAVAAYTNNEYSKTICEGEQYMDENFKQPINKAGIYRDTVKSVISGCDSIINVLTLTVNPLLYKSISESFCEGGSYDFNGTILTAAGTYYDTIPSMATGCDSIITLVLTMNAAPVEPQSVSICQGAYYEFGGKQLTEAGVYRDTTYANETNCMSITELTLTVNPVYNTSLGTKYINAGEEYDFFGEKLTATGSYNKTFTSSFGCDSTYAINLVVISDTLGTEEKIICESELPITWKGMQITKAGTYMFDTLTVFGTDSTVMLSLQVIEPRRSSINQDFCEGGSYNFNGTVLTAAGTYYDTVPSLATGCDSIITLVLTMNAAPVEPQSASICQGAYYEFGGKQLTEAGVYRDTTYANETNCMSITELTLTVRQPDMVTLPAQTICLGESVLFTKGMVTPTETSTYTDTLVNVYGCDSVIVMNVTVIQPKYADVAQTICQGDSYFFAGKNLTVEGVYRDTTKSVSTGCDSITILNLRVTKPVEYSFSASICQGGFYEFAGKQLTEAGSYADTVQSMVTGCDSIITLLLSVIQPVVGTESGAVCEGDSIEWHGQMLSVGGIYYDTISSKATGCDSIVAFTLTINRAITTNIAASICDGESYPFGGKDITNSGIYYDTLKTVNACDSIVILTLNVQTVTSIEKSAEICQGDSYEFGKLQLTTSGIYYDTIASALGCDSIITKLNLKVNEPTYGEWNVTICAGSSYLFGARELNETGVYVDTFMNRVGCDSIVTLNLTVAEPLRGTVYGGTSFSAGCTYSYRGKVYTEAGTFVVDTLTTENGCDSILSIVLTDIAQGRDTIEATMCAGECYVDPDFYACESGTYETEVAQEGGCAIIRTLILHVLAGDTVQENVVITTDDLPYIYRDTEILDKNTKPGEYTIQKQFSNGDCWQVVNFYIIVNEPQGVDNVNDGKKSSEKMIYNDQLYILRDDACFNAEGRRVPCPEME